MKTPQEIAAKIQERLRRLPPDRVEVDSEGNLKLKPLDREVPLVVGIPSPLERKRKKRTRRNPEQVILDRIAEERKSKEKIKKGRNTTILTRAKKLNPCPAACQECGEAGKLEAHHTIPYSELKRLGVVDDVNMHKLVWLCRDCHDKKHENEPVMNLRRRK